MQRVGHEKTSVFNDPLGQIHISASSYHYFHLKIVLLYGNLKSGDERTNRRK